MIFKNVRIGKNIKFEKTVSRYHPLKSSAPPKFGFPNNPWDNLDPNRMDKNLKDEFDTYNIT
jgi:hypothetical protein